MAENSMREYKFQDITGVKFYSNGTAEAWFNELALHSTALSLDLVHNAVIKAKLGPNYSIRVRNAPFKSQSSSIVSNSFDGFAMMFPMLMGLVLCITTPSFITFYIKV